MKEPLEWNEAQHKARIAKEKKAKKEAQEKIEKEENLNLASDELWNCLANENFRLSHFEEICNDYGIDEDDLLDRII